jgi:hypothetical protein
LNSFDKIAIRAKTVSPEPVKARIAFITKDVVSFSLPFTIKNNFNDTAFSLIDFKKDSFLLMPRPYPWFQPLWFKDSGTGRAFELDDVEKLEITTYPINTASGNKTSGIDIEFVRLVKHK